MENCYFFYRSDTHCLIAQDEHNQDWIAFVGFPEGHHLHGKSFHKCSNIGIHKYQINDKLSTSNEIWRNLWWMGFSSHPFSKEKTLEDLKKVADEIGTLINDKDNDSLSLI